MTETEIIGTKIDLLKERKDLFVRETDFKIALLEAKLKKFEINKHISTCLECGKTNGNHLFGCKMPKFD